jgi:transcriptional regulator with XRE-family HTH domain
MTLNTRSFAQQIQKPRKAKRTWTKADYRRAQHTAKQEYLLKELVNHLMASDWTKEELAAATGVHANTIERWRRGDTKYAITRTLTAVGKALGGTLGWTWY